MESVYVVHHAVVPVRKTADDRAEMVTQLLLGEYCELLDRDRQWLKVRNIFDGYEGWLDEKMVYPVDEVRETGFVIRETSGIIIGSGVNFPVKISPGSSVPVRHSHDMVHQFSDGLSLEVQVLDIGLEADVVKAGMKYLGVPYLWGGRSIWGIDCSGFTQMAFAICGIRLRRDASQQQKQGKQVVFAEKQAGDLAFFINEKKQVVHVGIVMKENRILHASGRVRVDKLTEKGIFNEEQGKLTHELLCVNRYI